MIGLAHVERRAIGIRIHRDRFDSQLAAGADNPHRDLSAVGNKHSLEHPSPLTRRSPDSWPRPSLYLRIYTESERRSLIAPRPRPGYECPFVATPLLAIGSLPTLQVLWPALQLSLRSIP